VVVLVDMEIYQYLLQGYLKKFAARYAPLALLLSLHDLPDNYMKSLPKFTGEGDLTTT
jgi:hypothetical protein